MKARIIAVANQKGGIAKTTSVASIGSILSEQGFRVLLVDLDTQANLTGTLLRTEPTATIYGALRGLYKLPQEQIKDGLFLVPSSSDLGNIEGDLAGTAERETILRDLLQSVSSDYNYILLDCPPSLGLITRNAFTAASSVLIPMTAEALPAQGLLKVEEIIEETKAKSNPSLTLGGIFLTRWESSRLSNRIEQLLRANYGGKVYETKIRKNIALAEAPLLKMTITDYSPQSNGAQDYRALTEELLRRQGRK